MGMDAAVVIVRRLLLIDDCYCSILRVIRVVGFQARAVRFPARRPGAGYFQHVLVI